MPLDLTTATATSAVPTLGSLKVSWSGSLPAGQVWQIYQGGVLAKSTFANSAHLPRPTGEIQIAIGSVPVADAGTSFASSLPSAAQRRVRIAWQGGRYEDPADGDVMGFHVYGEATPGAGVDYATVLYDQPVSIGGVATDGFGLGGFGSGGFGYTAGSYSWVAGPLASGTWHWAVVPYDAAGNEGASQIVSATVNAPPFEPPQYADGSRLHYTLLGFGKTGFGVGGFGEPEIELDWNASAV